MFAVCVYLKRVRLFKVNGFSEKVYLVFSPTLITFEELYFEMTLLIENYISILK